MLFNFFLTLLFASCFASAPSELDGIVLDAEFDKFVLEVCDTLHIPGISVAVINKHSFQSKVSFVAVVYLNSPRADLSRVMAMRYSLMSKLHQTLYGSQAARLKHSRPLLLHLWSTTL
jgi:hypothetical protein